MKGLHRSDLYCWSEFSEENNIDFHSFLWVREEGNIIIDPLTLSRHDEKHLRELGLFQSIVLTNSGHIRDSERISEMTQAQIYVPAEESEVFPFSSVKKLNEGDEVVPGLRVLEMEGSKTPGELALLLEDMTLICGDLVRSYQEGQLELLKDTKLSDKSKAIASVGRLVALPALETIILGDGGPVVHDAKNRLAELLKTLK